MIVNIRGTGGAGKSHVVREIMQRSETIPEPIYHEGRRQPAGYKISLKGTPAWVVGHYETPCGGGDTMKSPGDVFQFVENYAPHGHVIFEGIISQDDVKRTAEINRRHPIKVIALRVPINDCLAGIQARRDARGDERPMNPRNTVERAKRLEGIVSRLLDSGVDCKWMDRESALAYALEALGL